MFSQAAESLGVYVPADFLQLSISAMKHLANGGHSNVLYGIAKGMGTVRTDNSDSVFPVKRVVTGLVEYCVNFFNAGDAQNVRTIQ